MKKFMIVTLAVAASAFSAVAYAETTPEDVAKEADAIRKVDGDIAKQNANIEANRKEKAAAKNKGDVLDQASQSTQIGANKAARSLHKAEREYHEDQLQEKVDDIKKGE